MRLVSKWSKTLSDRHLRKVNPRRIKLRLDLKDNGEPEALQDFLRENENLAKKMLMPSSRFHLKFKNIEDLGGPEIQQFLKLNGTKVVHLRVSRMTLPMNSTVEFEFYRKLPNLRHLKEMIEGDNNKTRIFCPETFVKLKSIRFSLIDRQFANQSRDIMHGLIEYCKDMECFGYPTVTDAGYKCEPEQFEMINKVKTRNYNKNLQFYDMKKQVWTHVTQDEGKQFVRQWVEMVFRRKVNSMNLCTQAFVFFTEHHLKVFAPHILSLQILPGQDSTGNVQMSSKST